MQYILLDIGYQEVYNGTVLRYTDLDGNTIYPEAGYGGVVINATPPTPTWALPDPVEPSTVIPQMLITKLAYLRRFTQVERIAIRTAAESNSVLFDYLEMLKLAEDIDISDPDTVAAVQMLELVGLIGSGRAQEILNA